MKKTKLTKHDKEWLDAYRRELTEQFPGMVERMLIYGSKARGEATPDSDLDVLLIVRDEAAKRKRAMRGIGYLLDAEGYVVPSIMAYTVGEWQRLKLSGSRFREAVERDEVRVL
jgi:predicted nucleotidyltransferase